MKIIYIKNTRADINAHLALLKPAFNGVENAKAEYEDCCDLVRDGQAGFYQVSGQGINVRFCGLVTDDNQYWILAMTGRGLVDAAALIIDCVQRQGYAAIKYHTARQGMERILSRFGFEKIGMDGAESVLMMEVCDG